MDRIVLQVVDTAPPTLQAGNLSDVVLTCIDPIPEVPKPEFKDACDPEEPRVQYFERVVVRNQVNTDEFPAGTAMKLVRMWAAADAAGNKAFFTQVRSCAAPTCAPACARVISSCF